MQSGDDDDETSILSSGDVGPVHRALRNTTMPWVQLTGNKEQFTWQVQTQLINNFEYLESREQRGQYILILIMPVIGK